MLSKVLLKCEASAASSRKPLCSAAPGGGALPFGVPRTLAVGATYRVELSSSECVGVRSTDWSLHLTDHVTETPKKERTYSGLVFEFQYFQRGAEHLHPHPGAGLQSTCPIPDPVRSSPAPCSTGLWRCTANPNQFRTAGLCTPH